MFAVRIIGSLTKRRVAVDPETSAPCHLFLLIISVDISYNVLYICLQSKSRVAGQFELRLGVFLTCGVR